jgi:A/G-specific adenine glycosylase
VDKWPRVENLAAARDEDVMQAWAGLGYYARARNLLKCARVVTETHDAAFPDNAEALKTLPGIGDYTAAAVAAIAFNRVETVIDGNVDRVVSRWFAIETPLPDSKPEIRLHAKTLFEPKGADRPGDFAQAMMDLGATICIPQNPRCDLCPVAKGCRARGQGIAAELPRRKAKAQRPRRAGYVYWIENERGEILFETRPAKGLLGGMVGLPTSEWVGWPAGQRKWPQIVHKDGHISAMKIADDNAMKNDLKIRHTFTHFDLELRGVLSMVNARAFKITEHQFWVPASQVVALGLPTVFRKFTRLMDRA